jgi:hypothetical protein
MQSQLVAQSSLLRFHTQLNFWLMEQEWWCHIATQPRLPAPFFALPRDPILRDRCRLQLNNLHHDIPGRQWQPTM